MNHDPFGGLDRLYGTGVAARLQQCRVAVIGLGGVGSWTAEALVRSGIGCLGLFDPDEVCRSNINRQLHALHSTIGKSKGRVLAERFRDIHPTTSIEVVESFVTPNNVHELLAGPWDFIVDAVDRMSAKAAILHHARTTHQPILTVGGTAGRIHAARAEIRDLGQSGGDELLRLVRRKLRRDYGWEGGEGCHYGVPCVFSAEPMRYPGDGCPTLVKPDFNPDAPEPRRMDCFSGLGSAAFVTGTFGLLAANEVINRLAATAPRSPSRSAKT
jgi:tRNA A37 threonylcarbamoyladenosine dehydratase